MSWQFGPYRVEGLIARGGMGEVLRAYDTRHDRVVALKLLSEHFATDQEFQERFRREAHAVARLREPHVIPIHAYGEIDGRLYLDMRLVEGEDLAVQLDTRGAMDPASAVDIVDQVAQALSAAHAEGLVHRDVKPSNIIVGETGFSYLVDFGIARSLGADTGLTGTGGAIGTLDYMAPERFTDAPLDYRVDVYSLACVLHPCLTGAKPFAVSTAAALINAHLNHEPPSPSRYRPGLPVELDQVVARGMAKNPADRYSSAAELAAAARDALRTGQRLAGPVPPRRTRSMTTGELDRSKVPWLAVGLTVVVVSSVVAGFLALAATFQGDGQSSVGSGPVSVPSSFRQPGTTPTSTLFSPMTATASEASAGPEDYVEFVAGYYRLMPDTSTGWAMIGPNLQTRGRASYDRFWSKFSGAEVLARPTVSGNTVTARILLRYRDGRPPVTETHVLGVMLRDGRLCIDSDSVASSR